jgi:hypothetical protein
VLLVGDPSAAFTVVFGLLKRDDKEIGLFVLVLPLLKTSKLLLVVVVLRKEEDKEEERTTRVTDDDEDTRLAPTKGVVATVVMMVSRRPSFVCEERKEKKEGLVSHSFFFDVVGLRFLSILTTQTFSLLFFRKKKIISSKSSSSWPEEMMMQSTRNDARIALRIAVAKTIQTMMKRVKRISALAAEWSLQKTSTNWTLLPRKLAANQISSSPTMMMTRPKERIMCF